MRLSAHHRRAIPACLLLILFVGYVASTTLFYHTHIVNGERITHSHPFSQAPDTGRHAHSSAELVTIASLSAVLLLAPFLGFIFKLFATAIARQVVRSYHYYYNRHLSVISLRAPPFC